MRIQSCHIRYLLPFVVLLGTFTLPAISATLTVSDQRGQHPGIYIEGPITTGDAERLIAIQRERVTRKLAPLAWARLNSLGGSLSEAVKIASLIESFRLDTAVPMGAQCASSCFILYIAGSQRSAMGPGEGAIAGKVGVHRPFLDLSQTKDHELAKAAAEQQKLMYQLKVFLAQRNVPQAIIDRMMKNSSTEVYWLDDADLREVGFYSPSYEELIISRCGRSPDIARTLSSPSPKQGESDTIDGMDELISCQNRLMVQLRSQEVPALLKRMQGTWRPWK